MMDVLGILFVAAILVGGYFLVARVIAPRFRDDDGEGSASGGPRDIDQR